MTVWLSFAVRRRPFPAPISLGCSIFAYGGAEGTERRFNHVFLATYAVSGALITFTWEQTVPACSKSEYQHTETFLP